MTLPPYAPLDVVSERLPLIFPAGTANRSYCIRDFAAKTVFTMLYIGAVEGRQVYLGPKHVYRMTDEQAVLSDDAHRQAYDRQINKPGFHAPGSRWYDDTSREPIRDETLREALVPIGAVLARDDLPTTSSKPRYTLTSSFADLFAPALSGAALEKAIADWQTNNLSPSALARVSIMLSGAAGGTAGVLVTFPNRQTRTLAPGPSSLIAKSVIEDFAVRFLIKPAMLWLSESGNKVVALDDKLATAIGLKIQPDKNLPDIILADLGPKHPLLVFVEVVATDGPITPRRQEAIFKLTDAANFPRSQVTFLTAYEDRESAGYRKTCSALAWGSFAWFRSEPESLLHMRDGTNLAAKLADLVS